MEITRNNYEEYFLLFADNELTPTEKSEVALFVQQNPDLEEEFNMIRLTVSIPDEVTLTDKSFLLKNESFINETNYAEIFVLYHDHELSDEQKRETENFVAHHETARVEFELTGKAKLAPDLRIVYPHKKQLYRKERSRVIPLIFLRSVAAAVIIGFGSWMAVSYFNRAAEMPVASHVNRVPETTFSPAPQKPAGLVASVKEPIAKRMKKAGSLIRKPRVKEDPATGLRPEKDLAVKEKMAEEKPEAAADHQEALTAPVKRIPPTLENDPPISADETPVTNTQPAIRQNMTRTASYVPDQVTRSDNYVFYDVPAEEFQKSKVGGFLKKVKRIVERTNPITRLFEGDEEQVAAK